MLLQAIWHQSSLYVWADGEGPAAEVAPGRAIRPHPRALAGDALRALLGEICTDALVVGIAADETLGLWLPADVNGPMAPSQAQPTVITPLEPFTVPALRFTPADAIDLLAAMPDVLPPACGDSVRYWRDLARFVLDRLAHHQFFPDLAQIQQGHYEAQWRLLVTGQAEMSALEQFAAAMPPVCQAVIGVAPEAMQPARLVETFLNITADALIRRDVSHDDFFNRAHEKAAEALSAPEVRWLSSLLGTTTRVRGGADELAAFADMVRGWVARLDETRADEAMRLTFELLEPEDDDEHEPGGNGAATNGAATNGELPAEAQPATWRLRFLLESTGDDYEVVPVDELWKNEAGAVLGRSLLARRQRLTNELARAAELYPALEAARASATPSEHHLTTLDAHVFIRQWAPMLQDNGFGIRLPDWTARRDREIGLMLALRPTDGDGDDPFALEGRSNPRALEVSSGRLGLEHLLEFDWQIAVGDMKLTVAEFQALASRNTPLVKYNGQWIHLEPDAARRAMEYLQQKPRGRMTLAEAFRTAYGAQRGETGVPILGLTGLDWIDHLLKQSPGQLESLEQPPEFQGQLRPYQKRGLQWLAFLDRLGIGACLADDMGLGKTIQLISLLLQERHGADASGNGNGQAHRPLPTLLFAPTSVVGNWVRELERFAPSLKVMVHHGPDRLQGQEFAEAAQANDVVVTSYALAHRDAETLARPMWGRVALDEAQKIKNPAAASTQAIRAIPAARRVALTGTPIENHLSELWSIMELLNPGLLGSAAEFRERFAIPVEKLGDTERAQQLKKMIQPFVLRRTKSDPAVAGDLPEKMEQKVYCNLTPEQAAAYERITAEMLTQIDAATGIRRRGLILAALTRLKQACDHPILLTKEEGGKISGRSGKCERLVEMLEEVIVEGDAALIFTQYREMGTLLETLIRERVGHEPLFLHGGTPAKHRDEMIQRFQAGGTDAPRIFILSLRAGGLGLNLTAANHVFHFDRWWNPAVESQATDRAYRIGQTRKVQVHKFVCVGTIEERIDKLLSDKIALADRIVTTGDEWLTNLSTDELRNYLTLSREAVGDF